MESREFYAKLLRAKIKQYGLTKLLKGEGIEHKLGIVYRPALDFLAIGHDVYSHELWTLLGHPEYGDMNLPISQYQTWYQEGSKKHYSLEVFPDTPISEVEAKFDLIFQQCIAPSIEYIRDPKTYVEYAITHSGLLMRSTNKANEVLGIWSAHYGIDFVPMP